MIPEKEEAYSVIMSCLRHGRICIDGIIDLITSSEQIKRQGRYSAAVFLDIKRAFGSITHATILYVVEKDK